MPALHLELIQGSATKCLTFTPRSQAGAIR
jgi:hypothetical protein